MYQDTHSHGARTSTLWGKGPNEGSRPSTTWGRRGGSAVAVVAALALLVPVTAWADTGRGTYVAPGLLVKADKTPDAKLHVIVQSTGGATAAQNAVAGLGTLRKRLDLVGGVALDLPASAIKKLAAAQGLTVTSDALVRVSGSSTGYSSTQLWPYESGDAALWPAPSSKPQGPAIAIVDSGIDTTRPDFGNRVLAQVNLSSLTPTAVGDGRGHGTFVAGIAAGSAPGYAGGAPGAPLVLIRVMDDKGRALTSDVVAACQWILANKAKYNIRVANFSLHSAAPGHFVNDPLDKAVEKLWLSGVVVVAAAGNFGTGQPVRMGYAPGNDPFVITVGALDLGGTVGVGNDKAAPFSAYGYTYDGFLKPDLAAPGRYMVGPISPTATLVAEKPLNVVAPGYIQLSGTSFAAPVVAAAAQSILMRHPTWTPDQVKGALLLTTRKAPNAAAGSIGAGELDAWRAAGVSAPPNPNRALEQFLTADPAGGTVFDWATWENAVKGNAAWDATTWSDASWSTASWSDVTWSDASWSDASWSDASWSTASWSDASWSDASWSDAAIEDTTWSDAAEGDASPTPSAYLVSPTDKALILADPDLAPPSGTLP
jgi:serine protease AprX